jgi:hypothetical protein
MDTGFRRYDGVLCEPLLILLDVESLATVHLLKRSKPQHIVLLARFFLGQQCACERMAGRRLLHL